MTGDEKTVVEILISLFAALLFVMFVMLPRLVAEGLPISVPAAFLSVVLGWFLILSNGVFLVSRWLLGWDTSRIVAYSVSGLAVGFLNLLLGVALGATRGGVALSSALEKRGLVLLVIGLDLLAWFTILRFLS